MVYADDVDGEDDDDVEFGVLTIVLANVEDCGTPEVRNVVLSLVWVVGLYADDIASVARDVLVEAMADVDNVSIVEEIPWSSVDIVVEHSRRYVIRVCRLILIIVFL